MPIPALRTIAMKRFASTSLLSMLLCTLAACGGGKGRDGVAANGEAGATDLPAPAAASGAVTGNSSVGAQGDPVSLGEGPAPQAPRLEDMPLDANPEVGLGPALGADGLPLPPDEQPATEPDADDAIAAVRDYYAAINARSYGRAYALWSGGGGASGQSPQQFAEGFASTEGVSVELQSPGPVDAGAGQRYIQVPVSVAATQRDGSVRRYAGSYTLRRSVVDGSTSEQRAWRIQSADLREVQP